MENANNNIISSRSRNVKLASWRKPNSGWYKLNIDGTQRLMFNIEAMMWGVVEGLILAWMSGQRSIDVVSMLTSDAKDGGIILIRKARPYLKEWDMVIQLVYREGNNLVDGLALMAGGQALQSVFNYSPSVMLLDQLAAFLSAVRTVSGVFTSATKNAVIADASKICGVYLKKRR
ncbi:hypothetical protein CXB51_000159 [Gossypium anomalum]|uniref:RNase H type-1 domain-containing protein n=1 Tax=Gossypium anomalum TaxID=47600 RepID=A0A8J5ZJN0_9ROSI|nr:hypothetical protein CXB51_000159 [Gossypium anomalum]